MGLLSQALRRADADFNTRRLAAREQLAAHIGQGLMQVILDPRTGGSPFATATIQENTLRLMGMDGTSIDFRHRETGESLFGGKPFQGAYLQSEVCKWVLSCINHAPTRAGLIRAVEEYESGLESSPSRPGVLGHEAH